MWRASAPPLPPFRILGMLKQWHARGMDNDGGYHGNVSSRVGVLRRLESPQTGDCLEHHHSDDQLFMVGAYFSLPAKKNGPSEST
ncbi:MAG: hypothetical protein IPP22_15455 [Nitrosomonas sp.]|nr:hypothetical protein [Nitrosomonas sp.]